MPAKVIHEIKKKLVCPTHRILLSYENSFLDVDGPPWPDGKIVCPQGCEWAIRDGIPRFVSDDNYAESFGLQWRTFPRTELDSSTGKPYSRERLERCLGTPLEGLEGKVVLECGSGAGRFTELLVRHCEALVSLDLSRAVEANLANCGHIKPYILLQADLRTSPLPYHYFDIVLCLGVLQHTPNPEATLQSLTRYVKPGGCLIVDHYTIKNALDYIDMAYPLRALFTRLKPSHALHAVTLLTAVCDPIRRRTHKIPALDRIARRLLPTACYYGRYPELDRDTLYEWHQLDTHDWLTDRYKHFRTPKQIRLCLESLGLDVLRCELGGNGVEARALLPEPKSQVMVLDS